MPKWPAPLPACSRRKIISGVCSCVVLWPRLSKAQTLLEFNHAGTCNYVENLRTDNVYSFSSSVEAEQTIKRIADTVALPADFEVRAANVGNAAAAVIQNRRYILYSEDFMLRLTRSLSGDQSQIDWAGVTILAHEIGHHLSGHLLLNSGSRPPMELEADRFSGYVVARLGGTFEQATDILRRLAPEQGSETHPPRSARIEAVATGWRVASPLPDVGADIDVPFSLFGNWTATVRERGTEATRVLTVMNNGHGGIVTRIYIRYVYPEIGFQNIYQSNNTEIRKDGEHWKLAIDGTEFVCRPGGWFQTARARELQDSYRSIIDGTRCAYNMDFYRLEFDGRHLRGFWYDKVGVKENGQLPIVFSRAE